MCLFACLFVCSCVGVCSCCVSVCVCSCACVCACVHASSCVCVCACMCGCVHVFMHNHVYVCLSPPPTLGPLLSTHTPLFSHPHRLKLLRFACELRAERDDIRQRIDAAAEPPKVCVVRCAYVYAWMWVFVLYLCSNMCVPTCVFVHVCFTCVLCSVHLCTCVYVHLLLLSIIAHASMPTHNHPLANTLSPIPSPLFPL